MRWRSSSRRRSSVASAGIRTVLGVEVATRGSAHARAGVSSLIERMSRENPLWSRRRIAYELAKLGHCVDKDTVAKYMPKPAGRPRRPPSQTWKTFLRNHLVGTIAIDFLTVPTVTFDISMSSSSSRSSAAASRTST